MSNDEQYEIRRATSADAAQVVDFQLRMALETEDLRLDPEVVAAGVGAVFEDPRKGTYWIAETRRVAESGGEVIACLLTWPEWSDWRNAEVWWIASLYVVPAHRGRGIFRRLYDHLRSRVRAADQVGGLRLYVDRRNRAARGVYDSVGMSREHYELYEWLQEEDGDT